MVSFLQVKTVCHRFRALFLSAVSFLKSRINFPQFRSVRYEISVLYTFFLAVILVIFSGVIYLILSRTLYAELDNEAKLKAQGIVGAVHSYLEVKGTQPDALKHAIENVIASEDKILRRWWNIGFDRRWFERLDDQDLGSDYLNFVTPEGKSLLHSKNVTPELLKTLLKYLTPNIQKEQLFYVMHDGQRLRVINFPFYDLQKNIYTLQAGISPEPVVQLLQNWMNWVFLSIPIILILTSFMGRLLVSRILRPVEKITALANEIGTQDLSKRVGTEIFYKEMGSLVTSFNDMIARLEKSFKHIEQFSSHLAHELKTPLTIMRGETELALMAERPVGDYRQALTINLEEIATMLKIIDDLLLLARMDYQPADCFEFKAIDLAVYLQEIYEQSKILAKEKEIDLRLEVPSSQENIRIRGDGLHLKRLFLNLIDNAVKFTPAQGKVRISCQKEDDQAVVAVTDSGQGIEPENIQKIFERFYRGDTLKDGCGLGLSIAQSIAKAHNGRIEVRSDRSQGTTFLVYLPSF